MFVQANGVSQDLTYRVYAIFCDFLSDKSNSHGLNIYELPSMESCNIAACVDEHHICSVEVEHLSDLFGTHRPAITRNPPPIISGQQGLPGFHTIPVLGLPVTGTS